MIRKATPEDIEGVYECYKEFEQASYGFMDEKFRAYRKKKQPEEHLSKEFLLKKINDPKYHFLVADENGIAAYLFAYDQEPFYPHFDWPKTCYIAQMIVLPAFRGKSIASQLAEEMMKWARRQGSEYLELDVLTNNPAIDIYKKWGFEILSSKMRKRV